MVSNKEERRIRTPVTSCGHVGWTKYFYLSDNNNKNLLDSVVHSNTDSADDANEKP